MTDKNQWISRRYIAYRMLTNMWFLGAVWLYFYRLFITDQQVGFLDGMAFAIGLLAEVPSGALADRFGRDKLVRLGQLLVGTGLLIQASGSSFLPFFVGQAIVMIGISFVSGADEALFFQNFNQSRQSTQWRKLLTRGAQAALIGSSLAQIAGGVLHSINPRVPWLLTGASFLLSVGLIWSIKDTRAKNKKQAFSVEIREYFINIGTGFAQFRLPKLLLYVPLIVAVQGLFYTVGFGLLRLLLLDRFGFSPSLGSVAIAVSSLASAGILSLIHQYADRMSEKGVLVAVSFSAILGLVLSLGNIGIYGFTVILIFQAGEHILHPFMSEILNRHSPEHQRATVLSVSSFLRTLPYVFLAPVIGYLSGQDHLEYFMIFWSILISSTIVLYLVAKRKDTSIQIDE